MSYKQPTPTKPRQMTEEEKKAQVERFLSQKRESFAINILCNLCRVRKSADIRLVKRSVAMADALVLELYPLPEGEQADKHGE